jgi:hypothetical protein
LENNAVATNFLDTNSQAIQELVDAFISILEQHSMVQPDGKYMHVLWYTKTDSSGNNDQLRAITPNFEQQQQQQQQRRLQTTQ